MPTDEERFVDAVLRNDVNRAVLARGHVLEVPDWWLTAGAVFQTVWNVLDGRDPHAGIADYDLFQQRVRPNPVLDPREVYEVKTARWAQQWPVLTIDPWDS